jgi:hypothetical protein
VATAQHFSARAGGTCCHIKAKLESSYCGITVNALRTDKFIKSAHTNTQNSPRRMSSVYGSFVCSLAAEVGLPLKYSCGNSSQAAGTSKIHSEKQLLCGYQRKVACCSACRYGYTTCLRNGMKYQTTRSHTPEVSSTRAG